MTSGPLVAHSLREAFLFLMATPCRRCGKGPLHGIEPPPTEPSNQDAPRTTIVADCATCHDVTHWEFSLPGGAGDTHPVPAFNPTAHPSRILDVAQWMTLFGMIRETAHRQPDKQIARRLLIEAAQCLDEALKFYDDESDLPPAEAFFHDGSRERFRMNPQQFARPRLLHLRSQLPTQRVPP